MEVVYGMVISLLVIIGFGVAFILHNQQQILNQINSIPTANGIYNRFEQDIDVIQSKQDNSNKLLESIAQNKGISIQPQIKLDTVEYITIDDGPAQRKFLKVNDMIFPMRAVKQAKDSFKFFTNKGKMK